MIKVIKKDKTIEDFNEQKIIDAVGKSAIRAICTLTDEDYSHICNKVINRIEEEDFYEEECGCDLIDVQNIHAIVENVLCKDYPLVGAQYQQYRNYKLDFAKMLDEVYTKAQGIRYIGDVSNANTDSTMISTQRSLIYGVLNKELYKKFFLTVEERKAIEEGYIYIHDMKDRRDTINCCLYDVDNVLRDGFEMANIWYNEPKTVDTAFDVIGDIVLSSASQQYGGFTIPEIDKILERYVEKSYQFYLQEYKDIIIDRGDFFTPQDEIRADKYATRKVRKDIEQGFQGWEYKFNTVGSSRGDYPFIAMSFGNNQTKWGTMISEIALEVRKNGQGKEGFKKPVLFPKLTFLYDEEMYDTDKPYEWLFDEAIDCSSQTMYPDYLSLTGEGYIPSMYKKYGKVVSLMG